MRKYEYTFESTCRENLPKPITVLVYEPDQVNNKTGMMLFTHGWGGNRFQLQEQMQYTVDRFNLVCVSTEYRQSGYDFNPVTGRGNSLPYDISFLQTFDVLNALRETMRLYPQINRRRLMHYGVSQGGHICLQSLIFAPNTFAFGYASSPFVRVFRKKLEWAGRELAPWELSARAPVEHLEMLKCPVFFEHGTADSDVSVSHSQELETQLKRLKKTYTSLYYKDGGHILTPANDRVTAFKEMISDAMQNLTNSNIDDFKRADTIKIECRNKTLIIDWSQPSWSHLLYYWQFPNE
jgi:predicted esterase